MQHDLKTSLGLLALLWVLTAFGNSLQPIAPLAYAQPIVQLLSYDAACDALRPLVGHAAFILIQATGSTFAFSGAFAYPTQTVGTVVATIGLCSVLSAATTFGALLPTARLQRLSAALLPARGAPIGLAGFLPGLGQPADAAPASPLPLVGRLLQLSPLYAFPILNSGVRTITGMAWGHFIDPGGSRQADSSLPSKARQAPGGSSRTPHNTTYP